MQIASPSGPQPRSWYLWRVGAHLVAVTEESELPRDANGQLLTNSELLDQCCAGSKEEAGEIFARRQRENQKALPRLTAVESPASNLAPEPQIGLDVSALVREQDEIVSSLASHMNIVGMISLLLGAVLMLVGIALLVKKGDITATQFTLTQGAVLLLVGGYTVTAAQSFRQIADSPEKDVGQWTAALTALRNLYRLQVIILCISGALIVIGLLAGGSFSGFDPQGKMLRK